MNRLRNVFLAPSLALLLSTSLYAQDIYSIESMSLKKALEKISKESKLSFIADAKLLKGKKAPAIKNVKGLQNALNTILKNSGLEAVIENNMIVIRKEVKNHNSENNLGEVTIMPQMENSYSQFKQKASTGSKLGITIKETPASVEVLNSETMIKRGVSDVTDALTKATGITGGISGHGPGGRFASRGFTGVPGVTILNDGIKQSGTAFSNRAFETANLDRIEVIRGASSVLHGEVSVGGTVNLVTKKPSFVHEETELGLKIGSYDSYGLNFGSSGIAIEDKLAYRVDISNQEKGADFEGEKREVNLLSAALLYKINDNLSTSLYINKTKDDTKDAYTGTPLVNGKLNEKVRSTNYNVSKDNIEKGDSLSVRHNIKWQPTYNIEVNNSLYYQDVTADIRQSWNHLQVGNTDQLVIKNTEISQEQDVIGNRLDLLHTGDIFGLENKLLVGFDVNKIDYIKDSSVSGGSNYTTNIYNPQRGYYTDLGGTYKGENVKVDVKQVSLYFEDQLNITEDFKLLAGLRYDKFDGSWDYLRKNIKKDKTFNEFSYRVGAVYDLNDSTTFYATYSEAIEAGYALVLLSDSKLDLDFTEAKQFEIGLKQSFLDDKAEFTASAYKIVKENIFSSDPNDLNKVENAGKQTSKGFELALAIKPIEQLQVDANLSYTDAKYDEFMSKSNDYSGNTPHSIPKYIANLGLRYMPTKSLGIGTWVNYVDGFYVDNANSIKLPSYTTVDLTLDYAFNDNTTFTFAVKNLTNELYATSGRNRAEVFLGDARNFEFGINYKF